MSTVSVPPHFPPPRRIAIFRALQLGDMLCAVPALRALRNAWPDAHITLIGLPWAQRFVERFPMLVDALAIFPGARGFPEQPETDAGLPRFFAQMRERRFDLAIRAAGEIGGNAAGADRENEDHYTRGIHTLHFPHDATARRTIRRHWI